MSEFIVGLSGHMIRVSEIVTISITSNQEEVDDLYYNVQVLLKNGHVIPVDVYLPSVKAANDLLKEIVHAMRFSDVWLYTLHNHRNESAPEEIQTDDEIVTQEETIVENEEDGDEFTTF